MDYSSRMYSDTMVLSGPDVMLSSWGRVMWRRGNGGVVRYGPGGRRQVQRTPFPS